MQTKGLMGPYLKDSYATCRRPSTKCGGSHHRLSRGIGTLPTSRPHDIQCGYRCRRISDKQWLQMRYCITEGDIDMVIKDWEDEWRILVLTQEFSKRTVEEEARWARKK
jgi:hypothetical protein